ncbi:hypothetical protein [Tenacibaculum ascidiaceicola]|uniref:hypothetical protein n=1 Tax=Tenacibaculum ascidiaceicola TaxID=1699411 RepID=UPI00389676BF
MKVDTLSPIEQILEEIYSNDIKLAVESLKKYQLYEIIQKSTSILEEKKEKPVKVITHLAGVFLSSVNKKIINIDNLEDKMFLKCLISDIGVYLIKDQFKKNKIDKFDIKEINNQLKTVCELENYDFYELKSLLNLEHIYDFLEVSDEKSVGQTSYYEWLADPNVFHEVIGNLKSEKMIDSVKDFKKLFTSNPVKIKFNVQHKDFLVVFIDYLFQKKYLKTKIKRGHFTPIKNFVVDHENNFLFNGKVKYDKARIKKNEELNNQLLRKVKNWVE